MRVLHIAAANRWTGAAAPAFAEVEALRAAGVDAHYVYVGGYKLEEKIGHHDFAHPLIHKAQHPMGFLRSLQALDGLVTRHGFDVLHSHLTYDHWLARMIARDCKVRLARTFHARRALRGDPLTASLIRKSSILCVVNDAFRDAAALRNRQPAFTPPPIDRLQFHPEGRNVRDEYGITSSAKVVTVIGKLSRDRGFEDALQAFAHLRPAVPGARLMVIGHGKHRPALEAFAQELGIAPDVIWAGYHEDDLAEHYRATDVLLFTATGSDGGHRAILEAMACGVPCAAYPLEGVEALGVRTIAEKATPVSLSRVTATILSAGTEKRMEMLSLAERFDYKAASKRLIDAYTTAR